MLRVWNAIEDLEQGVQPFGLHGPHLRGKKILPDCRYIDFVNQKILKKIL